MLNSEKQSLGNKIKRMKQPQYQDELESAIKLLDKKNDELEGKVKKLKIKQHKKDYRLVRSLKRQDKGMLTRS
jgi:hypothetical protein